MNKNIIQTILGLLIGGVLLFFTLKDKPLGDILQRISGADIKWVLASGLILVFIFFLRAMRWRVLLQNVNYQPTRVNTLHALVMGFFVNSFTPRLGEVVRCTSLNKSSDIPVSASLGSVVSERVWDVVIMLVGLGIVFLFEMKRLGDLFFSMTENVLNMFNDKTYLAIGILIAAFVVGYIILQQLIKRGLFNKITGFIQEILNTVKATFTIKKYPLFLLITLGIWGCLIAMNYCFLQALPNTNEHGLYFAAVVLFVGSIGWAMPTPSGIGTTHFIILQLFIAFSLTEEAGVDFGIISNGLTFIYTLLFGFVALGIKALRKVLV